MGTALLAPRHQPCSLQRLLYPAIGELDRVCPRRAALTIPGTAQSPFGLLPQLRNRVSLRWPYPVSLETFFYIKCSQTGVQRNSGPREPSSTRDLTLVIARMDAFHFTATQPL